MDLTKPNELPKFLILRGADFGVNFYEYQTSDDGKQVSKFLHEPNITVKNTSLTYRTVNHWDSLGLLLDERKDSAGWRKFGLLDLYWLSVINTLRDYGFPTEKIKKVKKYLFEQRPNNNAYPIFEYYLALTLTHHKECYVIILPDGQADIAMQHEIEETKILFGISSYISISLDTLTQKIFRLKEVKNYYEFPIYLSAKEILLLLDIREGKYESITIHFKNGQIERLDKTENLGAIDQSYEKLREILKEEKFQNIMVKTEMGKTVSIKRTIKVK